MSRIARRIGRGLTGIAVLAAGCAGPYEKPTTSDYVIGALFLLVGLALGYALIVGRK